MNNISVSKSNKDSSMLTIRDVWQRFVCIQESIIKQRCTPIPIIPNSAEFDEDRVKIQIDESANDRQLNSIIKDELGIDEFDLESGFLQVPENIWNSLTEQQLGRIRDKLSECYVELDTTPSIDVEVNYGGNISRSDQLSIDELYQLESSLKSGEVIEGSIDTTVAFISKVTVRVEDYCKYLFGEHYSKKESKTGFVSTIIRYDNQYIPWNDLRKYSQFGLFCKGYSLSFKVNNLEANNLLKYSFDCYSQKTDTYVFERKFTETTFYQYYIEEANVNIRDFLDEASIYCALNDIEIETSFFYQVSGKLIKKFFLKDFCQYIKDKGDNYSFNEETGAIGIDFNWKNDNINDIISGIEKDCPFIKINSYDSSHKFKCKVKTQLKGFDVFKRTIEDRYEDIYVENDSIHNRIIIRLPFIEQAHYDIKRTYLEEDLRVFTKSGLNVKFADTEKGKVRLNIKYNKDFWSKDMEESLAEIRKSDFGFIADDNPIPFGKLIKIDLPFLSFDIIGDEKNYEKIVDAFNSGSITRVVPTLTGELEKISRLKKSFNNATTGTQLVNPRLQRFIFNSEEAEKTQDIEFILRKDGTAYRELCENLLNTKINESQKEAILKAMYAEDLAVIQGPPGTGKSTAIAELIWQLVLNGTKIGNASEKILLTSETNLAVDNAISRIINNKTNLVKPIRFGDVEKLESEGLQFSFDLMKRWVEEGDECLCDYASSEENNTGKLSNFILKNWIENIASRSEKTLKLPNSDISERWHKYLLNPSKNIREIIYRKYIQYANVIGATCSSIGDVKATTGYTSFFYNYCEVFEKNKKKDKIRFTTVIQDESSKATPAELVLPFIYGKRAIVIGDHRQLPPMLDKEEFENTLNYNLEIANDENEKNEIIKLSQFVQDHFDEMEVSHFQRLYENIDSSLKGTFNLQYRMHPDINEVIEQFYQEDGGLYCGLTNPKDLGVDDPNFDNPASRYHGLDIRGLFGHNTHVLFINSTSPEMIEGTSRVNYGEIDSINKLLTRFENSRTFKKYLDKFTNEEDKQIGIISFYGKQIRHLSEMSKNHPSIPIRVSTVDKFQGMERNIIIVSMVRSNIIQSTKNQQPDRKRYPEYGYPTQHSLGFAQSPNRLNVALSRAKRLLVIVGNRNHFSSLEIYERLFSTIEANHNNKIINQEEL